MPTRSHEDTQIRAPAARRAKLPDVKLILEGDVTPEGIKWRTNPYTGKDLVNKETGAWVQRRTSREGDATDHDPPSIALKL